MPALSPKGQGTVRTWLCRIPLHITSCRIPPAKTKRPTRLDKGQQNFLLNLYRRRRMRRNRESTSSTPFLVPYPSGARKYIINFWDSGHFSCFGKGPGSIRTGRGKWTFVDGGMPSFDRFRRSIDHGISFDKLERFYQIVRLPLRRVRMRFEAYILYERGRDSSWIWIGHLIRPCRKTLSSSLCLDLA